ncbi:MAG: nitroreductase family protein [Candidatus Nanohaloarchaea archaeon]
MTAFESAVNLEKFEECRDERVEREKIGKVLEAGRNSPSPQRTQTVEFVVVESQEDRETLSEITGDERLEKAPTSIILVSDLERIERRTEDSDMRTVCMAEAASAAQNMRLVAQENGLASIWLSGFDEVRIAERFDIPEGKTPLAIVSLAYTDEPVPQSQKFGLNEICFYDRYGNKIDEIFEDFEWKGVQEEAEIYSDKAKGLLDRVRRKIRKVL